MARYHIQYWGDIPSMVTAEDESGSVKAMLPQRFQEAIDRAAMAAGETSADAYMDGWRSGPEEEREGTAQEVVDALVTELEGEFTKERLAQIVMDLRS